MRQTTSDILAVQEVSQVMLGNPQPGGMTFFEQSWGRPLDIFDLPLVLWVYVVRRDAKSSLQRTVSDNEVEIGCW